MFGQGSFVAADFCGGAGVVGVVLFDVAGAAPADEDVFAGTAPVPVDAPGAVAADAPAMPAAVPPVASAPATIVAPSILEMRMG